MFKKTLIKNHGRNDWASPVQGTWKEHTEISAVSDKSTTGRSTQAFLYVTVLQRTAFNSNETGSLPAVLRLNMMPVEY